MSIAGGSDGDVLGFTIQIMDGNGGEAVRRFRKQVKETQEEATKVHKTELEKQKRDEVRTYREIGAERERLQRERERNEKRARDEKAREEKKAESDRSREARQRHQFEQRQEREKKRENEKLGKEMGSQREKLQKEREREEKRARADAAKEEKRKAADATKENKDRYAFERRQEADRKRSIERARQGTNDMSEAVVNLSEQLFRAARGFTMLGLVGEKESAKIIDALMVAQGATDIGMGAFRAGRSISKLGRGARMAGGMSRGGVAGFAAAATSPVALAGAGAVAGAVLGGASALDFARGNPAGGMNDTIARNVHVPLASALHSSTGGWGTWAADKAVNLGGAGAIWNAVAGADKAMGFSDYTIKPSEWVVNNEERTARIAQLARMGKGKEAQERLASSGRIANNFSRNVGDFGGIGAGFRPDAFNLMSGSSANMRERLAARPGSDAAGQFSEISGRIGVARKEVTAAFGNREAEVQANEHLNQLLKEREGIMTNLAGDAAEQLRIVREEANVAKERLQSAGVGFALMDKGSQNNLLRVGRDAKAAMALPEGAARDAALARFTPQQLQMIQGAGTQFSKDFVNEVAGKRDKEFRNVFGGAEQQTIKDSAAAEGGIEASTRKALAGGGVNAAVGKLSDVIVSNLKAGVSEQISLQAKIIDDKFKIMRKETTEAIQKAFNDKGRNQEQTKAQNPVF